MALVAIPGNIISIIGRILSETAPLYLTAGLSSSSDIALNRPGTTLTTHIYAQIFSTSQDATWIQYETAFVAIMLVFSLVIIGYVIIPARKTIKNHFYQFTDYVKDNYKNKKKETV